MSMSKEGIQPKFSPQEPSAQDQPRAVTRLTRQDIQRAVYVDLAVNTWVWNSLSREKRFLLEEKYSGKPDALSRQEVADALKITKKTVTIRERKIIEEIKEKLVSEPPRPLELPAITIYVDPLAEEIARIRSLGLSTRTQNTLTRNLGITFESVDQLYTMTDDQLKEIKGVKRKGLADIRKVIPSPQQ
jgi:hypothetical protein